ncbi:MAG TPA: hypothetical protein VNJ53_04095 [Gaiellaceae bacterium]|nr:hypothetical protein [Gaiellaceae bacterium]
MAVPIRKNEPSIYVDGNEVFIDNLRCGDSELLALVREAPDPEPVVQTCLAVGARAVRLTGTTAEAAAVEARFAALEHRVEQGVTRAVELIGTTAAQYLDPERGALKSMLDELEKCLGDAFDPESKASVLAKFEGLLAGGTVEMKKAVRDMVDPGNPESPLGRLRAEMGGELKEVRQALEQLRRQVAVEQTEAEVLELAAVKGRKFEETVYEAATGFVSLYGDEVELVGDHGGAGGSKCGDIAVTLNEADTPGMRAQYVVEVKDRKLSLRDALRELERAMRNRDAKAGVIVFSSQEKAPIAVPLQLFGNKAIAVFDKEDLDERPLRLALVSARCALQRQLYVPGEGGDVEAALALVEEGQRALACHSAIKRCHSAAQNQITSAAGQVHALVQQLDEILGQIALKLRSKE